VILPDPEEARLRKGKFRQSPVHELTPDEMRARAEARVINLEKQKADAPVAMREYRDAEQAARDKTAKLRALRLAREAAEKK
jgi:hypothetical protein